MSHSQPALSPQEVQKIAHLARLAITDEQAIDYATSLSDILALMQALQNTDTSSIDPLFSPHDRSTPLREDIASAAADRDANQKCAPATEDGLYLVPKVIE